jgi:hypothetical protein
MASFIIHPILLSPTLSIISPPVSKILFCPRLTIFLPLPGPKGPIRKAVMYTMLEVGRFNLAFGDWNEEYRILDDSVRTNNGDRDKVLATVAFTALDFTNQFPNTLIHIKGSTSARTRLYQMGIGNNLPEISKNFEILGFYLQKWEPFIPRRNYDAFLAQRK